MNYDNSVSGGDSDDNSDSEDAANDDHETVDY